MSETSPWVTDFAQELAQTDARSLDAHIAFWRAHQERLLSHKRQGVDKKLYDALSGSYKAVRIAVTFLEDYRSHQWQLPQADQ